MLLCCYNMSMKQSPSDKQTQPLSGFVDFIREQGVVGLAVGIILGASVKELVSSLVSDLINPIIGIFMGKIGSLKGAYISVGSAKILWGNFVNTFIDFLIIAIVVYFGVKLLRLDSLDKKKSQTN